MKKIKNLLIFISILILLIPISVFAQQQKSSTVYNFYFRNLINTSGELIEEVKMGTSKIEEGIQGSKAQKWFVNYIQGKLYYKGTYQNVEYVFNGQFLDESGNPITFPIKTKYIENTPVVDIYLYPQYDANPLSFLHFNYIDNISTGSGSWANQGSAVNYIHTFKEPDSQEGYRFIIWRDTKTNEEYNPEDTYSCDISALEEGETKEVNIYAVWQPSLTVNWYDEENLLNSQEVFTGDIQAYSIEPVEKEGMKFIGWTDEEGNIVDINTIYSTPGETIEAVERKIINLYATYEEIPKPDLPAPLEPTLEPTPLETSTPEPTEIPVIKPTKIPTPTILPEPTYKSTTTSPDTRANSMIKIYAYIILITIIVIIIIIDRNKKK